MANKKISELTAATGVNYTDTVPIVQTGSTKRITMSQFALRWNSLTSKWDANSSKLAGLIDGVADDEAATMRQVGTTVLSMSGTLTMTVASRQVQVLDPNGSARTVTLPTTSVSAGDIWEITNTSSTYILTINSSSGSLKTNLLNGTVRLVATQATPTSASHWRILTAWQDWVSFTPTFNLSGTGGKTAAQVWTSTSVSYGAFRRTGSVLDFIYRLDFGANTTSVGGAAEARWELPNSLTVTSFMGLGATSVPHRLDGSGFYENTGLGFTGFYAPTAKQSLGYLTLGVLNTSSGGQSDAVAYNALTGVANTSWIVNGKVGITEWAV